jgi:hypothetical protein
LSVFSGDALVAVGRVRDVLVRELIAVPLLFAMVVMAVPHGLFAIAYVFSLVGLVEFLVSPFYLRRALGIRIEDVARAARHDADPTVHNVDTSSKSMPDSTFFKR